MTLTPLAVLLSLSVFSAEKAKTFGTPPTLTDAVAVADVLEKPAGYHDREILLEGKVAKVCQKKGCWLVLKEGEKDIRMTFKDYGFFVPKDSMGKRVRAQGVLEEVTLSVKEARHYLKDEGASKAEIKKVTAPVKTSAFIASGLTFLD